ncbi:dienelactone hydrolase family protein [Chitinophaga sp. GCM10012297]|uniref:Dienelactone hydrolase family protein n=1 Tax=Chitinophaga chungangae TaxID=2821488 RepID=A0ABS3YBQ6_9BACT|nr:dienelactone hydrolase family protein [Chitinophaga chungangae]MBO9152118.1 dienelactone hydrolase family protein [Chitinophaga chungangae]
MKKPLFFLTVLFSLIVQARAQQTPGKFTIEINYLLALPEGYAAGTAKKWPLVLFLHGSGESGNDLEKVKVHALPKLLEEGKKFPFIVVSPQSSGFGWDAEQLYRLLLDIKKKYRVDDDRVYLTGLSMGGFGTWSLAARHPETFAAIAPICGGGNPEEAWKMRYLPVWCFHGAKDNVVPITASQRMITALKPFRSEVKFTVYPEAGHDSWTETYNNDSLYTWLLSHSRHQFKPVTLSEKQLSSREGLYVSGKDTVVITAQNGGLMAKHGPHTTPLKAAAPDIFYWAEKLPMDVEFTKEGFVLRRDVEERFRKIK